MLTYAMDNCSTSTIILISGDRDFLYAVSILRLRRFRVVLMTPSNVHSGLKAQASLTYEWPRQILQADAMGALGQSLARHEKSGSISARIGLPTPPAPKNNLPGTPAQVVAPPPPPSPQAPTYSRAGAPAAGSGTRARSGSMPHSQLSPLAVVEPAPSTSATQVSVSPSARRSFADIAGRTGVPGESAQVRSLPYCSSRRSSHEWCLYVSQGDTQVSHGNEDDDLKQPWRSSRVMAAVAALERVGIMSPTVRHPY